MFDIVGHVAPSPQLWGMWVFIVATIQCKTLEKTLKSLPLANTKEEQFGLENLDPRLIT